MCAQAVWMRALGRGALHNRTLRAAYRRQLSASKRSQPATLLTHRSRDGVAPSQGKVQLGTHCRLLRNEPFRRATSAPAAALLTSQGYAVQLARTTAPWEQGLNIGCTPGPSRSLSVVFRLQTHHWTRVNGRNAARKTQGVRAAD